MNKKPIIIFLGILTLILVFLYINKNTDISNITNTCPTDIQKVTIRGDSLSTIYSDGDEVKIDYNYLKCNRRLGREDIIVYEYSETENPIIKIIKAGPGDKLEVKDELIYVNGKILKNTEGEEYKDYGMIKMYADEYKNVIPLDTYLILGNQIDSYGSNKIGLIGVKGILGKVVK